MANIDNVFRVEGLSLNDSTGVFTGTGDPTAGEAAPAGSLYLRSNGELYLKKGALDTEWELIALASDAQGLYDLMHEPTGFPNRTDTTIVVDDATRKITIAPTGASFSYYIDGRQYVITSPLEFTFTDVEGMHYFYLDENLAVIHETGLPTVPELIGNGYYCALYWSVDQQKAIYAADERHGLTMDGITHLHFHTSIGTQYISGLGLNSIVIDGGGDAAADAQLGVDDGQIRDEDLGHNIVNGVVETTQTTESLEQVLDAPAQIPILYRSGADADWHIKDADTFPLIYSGQEGYVDATDGLPPYNEYTGTTWTLTAVPDGQWFFVHYVATNDWRHPVMGIQGTNAYSTKPTGFSQARLELFEVEGMPFTEYVPIASVIYKADSTYSNAPKVTMTATDEGLDFVDWRKLDFSDIFGNASITDHANLTGLDHDDHLQYHNDARGDARYYTQGQVDTLLAAQDETTEITAPYITGATYTDLQKNLDFFHSSGVVSGGWVTDNGDNTITVSAGYGFIRLADDPTSQLYSISWDETILPVTATDLVYWVEVRVNGGSAEVYLATGLRPPCTTNIHLGQVVREGTEIHIFASRFDVGDHARTMLTRMQEVAPFAHASGASLGEAGTRNITLTAGKFWHGLTALDTDAYDTSNGGTFSYYYRDGAGGWNEVINQTQISNTLWDNNSGTLQPLSPTNYGVHWVYIQADNGILVLYGRGDYTLQQAQDALPPSDVPLTVAFHSRLVGKIIIQESAASFTSVQSAFSETFTPSSVTDHKNLLNIGTYTHDQIDAHIDDLANPHSTTIALLDDVNPAITPAAGHMLYYDNGNSRWDSQQFYVSGTNQVLQEVNGAIGKHTGTSTIALSATAPTSGQGTQIISHVFTPAQSGSNVAIQLSFQYSIAIAVGLVVAVFKDGTCIGVGVDDLAGNNDSQMFAMNVVDTGPHTEGVPVTYTVRVGATSATTWYVNQTAAYPTLFGDLPANNVYRIQEVVSRT